MATSYTRKAAFARKPASPQEQLERALQIAHEKGLSVAFAGKDFWAVPSDSESLKGLYHVVTLVGKNLHCECLWAQRGRICSHRAVVWEYLKQLADAAKKPQAPTPAKVHAPTPAPAAPIAQPVAPAKLQGPQAAPIAPERASLTPAKRRETSLIEDNAPFSVYKTPERRYQSLEDEYASRDGYASSDYYQHAYR